MEMIQFIELMKDADLETRFEVERFLRDAQPHPESLVLPHDTDSTNP